MSTGVIFILGKGVSPILASGVKSTLTAGVIRAWVFQKLLHAAERKSCRVTPLAWYNRGTKILRKGRIANRRKSRLLKSIS